MKLTAITLHRFRSAVDLTLNVDARRILVSGRNNSGKTTIRDCLRWALLGHCTGTDARGIGWESLVPYGDEHLAVRVEANGSLGIVERHYHGSSRELVVHEVKGGMDIHQQAIFARLNTTPAYLEAVLDTGYFLSLNHVNAKALVLELLNVRILIGNDQLTLDQVDSRYKLAFEERKLAKAKLKSHAVLSAPMLEDGKPMPTVAAIDEQLQRIRTELGTLQTSAGVSVGKRETLERMLAESERLESVPAVPDDMLAEIDRIELILAEPEPEPQTNPHADLCAKLKAHKPANGCVLDPEIPCETSRMQFTRRARVLTEAFAPVPEPNPARPDRRAVLKELTDLRTLRDRYQGVMERNADKRGTASRLRAELAAIPEVSADTTEIEALQARIRKGEMLRARAVEFWTASKRAEESLKEHQNLQAAVDALEQQCELLGPNGARVGALRTAISAFEERINAFTSAYGWRLLFNVEPWGVLVNDRPVETYSESEQFRLGIALQLAIAELSGLSFAVIDRLDMLDRANRAMASQMILEAPVGQIILLATREPEQPLPASRPGELLSYRFGLEDERTVVLEGPAVEVAA